MSAAQVNMTPMTNQSKRSISRVVKASASILSNCGYSLRAWATPWRWQ